LDIPRLKEFSDRFGSVFVTRYPDAEQLDVSDLKKLPVDILCPCARHHSLLGQDAGSITARIISPGANNALTPKAELQLAAKGAVCIPDFVANCGGVLGATMEFASIKKNRIIAYIAKTFEPTLIGILKQAAAEGCSPREIAETRSLRNMEQIQRRSIHPSFPDKLFRGVLEIYRWGFIPGWWAALLARPYFRRIMMPAMNN
jgi:glutamate dehydrogenase (NAD(P)+)